MRYCLAVATAVAALVPLVACVAIPTPQAIAACKHNTYCLLQRACGGDTACYTKAVEEDAPAELQERRIAEAHESEAERAGLPDIYNKDDLVAHNIAIERRVCLVSDRVQGALDVSAAYDACVRKGIAWAQRHTDQQLDDDGVAFSTRLPAN